MSCSVCFAALPGPHSLRAQANALAHISAVSLTVLQKTPTLVLESLMPQGVTVGLWWFLYAEALH